MTPLSLQALRPTDREGESRACADVRTFDVARSVPAIEQTPDGWQYTLGLERQLTLDGREEPLLEAVSARAELTSTRPSSSPAPSLFSPPQLVLPLPRLHPVTDGKPHKDCLRGFSFSACPHHPPEQGAIVVHPETCARQRCESSFKSNSLERAKDAWNGTCDRKEERIGLRHFGDMPWGIFVFTLPAELRHLCVGDRLRKFRRAAAELALLVISRAAGTDHAELYARSWFHPVGDAELPGKNKKELEPDQGETYKPHENVLIPLAFRHGGTGRCQRLSRCTLPKSWLGKDGWVGEEWRNRLVAIFGPWWLGDELPAVDWFYEYRDDAREKAFALKYFGRVFPRFAQHADVPLRPRTIALGHWKRRSDLRELLKQTRAAELPVWGSCATCAEERETPPVPIRGTGRTEDAALHDFFSQLSRHDCETCGRREGAGHYVQHRRTMGLPAVGSGPGPPSSGPSRAFR